MLQKRPKWLLFQNSLSKYLKSQKERFRAIFDQINSDSGLNDPLKTDHFSPHQRLWWWRAERGGLGGVAYKEVMHLVAWVLGGACKLFRVFRDGLG
jgi:hypothetical protein